MSRLLALVCLLTIVPIICIWRIPLAPVAASAPFVIYLPLVTSATQPSAGAAGPAWGTPIAVSPLDGSIWTVNPDADTVTVIDAENHTIQAEIVVGREPWALAIDPTGQQIYVLNRGAGSVSVIDTVTRQVQDTVLLGPEPGSLALSPTGRNAYVALDLDALAAFMAQGIRVPTVPQRANLAQGRRLFIEAGCAACHGGPTWTRSAMPGPAGTLDPDGNGMVDAVLHDVGTVNPRDIRGATGFDVPSLLGVGLTPPYLHDGSYWTLEALLASGHPDPDGVGNGLTPEESALLSAFLRAIGPDTEPIEEEGRQ